jgi:protein-disulfide isomerase
MRDRPRLVAISIMLSVALLAGARVVAQAPAPTASMAVTAEQRVELERWWDAQPKISMPFENDGVKVLIVEFTDLQCPFCRQKYIELKPILEKYAARPKDVKVMVKHWPIDPACNAGVSRVLHPAACDAAAAVVMARRKGTADALKDWFFLHQDQLNAATIRRTAADVGKITDFEAQYARAIQEVKTDAAVGSGLAVNSTPSFFLNGRRIPGGLAPHYFAALIEIELTRAK